MDRLRLILVASAACCLAGCGEVTPASSVPSPSSQPASSVPPSPPATLASSAPSPSASSAPTSSAPSPPASSAPSPPAVAAPAASPAYFAGVWTTSDVSYDAAALATEATRFTVDGKLTNGAWSAKGGRFTPARPAGPSPGFVARYVVDAATKTIRFLLDGAEEHATFTIEGSDRWKTVATTPQGTFVVYYYRRRP
ncbi:MAG: hypothetical protein QM820_19425 [Minicystis sp.]